MRRSKPAWVGQADPLRMMQSKCLGSEMERGHAPVTYCDALDDEEWMEYACEVCVEDNEAVTDDAERHAADRDREAGR